MSTSTPRRVGFNLSLRRTWLDAAAEALAEEPDAAHARARLDQVLAAEVGGAGSRLKKVQMLMGLWASERSEAPDLRDEAQRRYLAAESGADRLWLHYGLTLLASPVFRQTAAAIGQLTRTQDTVDNARLTRRLAAERGAHGSLGTAIGRVLTSLVDWGLLERVGGARACRPPAAPLRTADCGLEAWLLAAALRAHPAESIPVPDLLRLPELFAFGFSLDVDDLRERPDLALDQQGGWFVARAVPPPSATAIHGQARFPEPPA